MHEALDPLLLKRRLVAEIRGLHARRLPLNINAVKRHSPHLMTVVYSVKPYWGWRAALEEAGLNYEVINTEIATECECRICGRSFVKMSFHLSLVHEVSAEDYRREFPGAEIDAEIIRVIRTKKKPGVPHWEKLWSPEYVLDRLTRYFGEGWAVHSQSMAEVDRPLLRMAERAFGSWDQTLLAAGLDPEKIRLGRKGEPCLSQGEVIEELKTRWEQGHSLYRDYLEGACPAEESAGNRRLIHSVYKWFTSYAQALELAGIPLREALRGRRYSPEDVEKVKAEAIRVAGLTHHYERASAAKAMRRNFTSLVNATMGSWRAVADAVGVEAWRLHSHAFPVDEAVAEGMQWYKWPNGPLRKRDIEKQDPTLALAVEKHFGSVANLIRYMAERTEPTGTSTSTSLSDSCFEEGKMPESSQL
ncbi:MAG TPA: hypothetical protein VK970_08915 [Candidatus Methylacidiphilales bacterium]|nr:hypothetical protein [Candidatus Methylacidiphilales bacterium]